MSDLDKLELTLSFLRSMIRNKSPFARDREGEFQAVVEVLSSMYREWSERERFLQDPEAD